MRALRNMLAVGLTRMARRLADFSETPEQRRQSAFHRYLFSHSYERTRQTDKPSQEFMLAYRFGMRGRN